MMVRRGKRLVATCTAVPAALLLVAAPLAPALAKSGETTVEAGPIWNQIDAESKCPKAAGKAGGTWTGKWWTTKPGRMSVCEIKAGSASRLRWPEPPEGKQNRGSGRTVEVGPIWNQIDAQNKCPKAAQGVGATWTGQWWTTVPGRMSVCEIKR